jgi:hypothetical protein
MTCLARSIAPIPCSVTEVIVAPPQTDLIRWQTQSFWLLGDARLSRSSGSLD